MKALLAEPGFLAPSGTIGADISYLLAVVFTVLFLIAWGMAKKSQGTRHHKLILVSMVSMIIYFVGYYYADPWGFFRSKAERDSVDPMIFTRVSLNPF